MRFVKVYADDGDKEVHTDDTPDQDKQKEIESDNLIIAQCRPLICIIPVDQLENIVWPAFQCR